MKVWEPSARAFAEALFSDDAGPPPAERLDWLMAELADFVEQSGPRVAAILSGGLFASAWLAPPLIGRLPPFSRLSVPDRCAALERLERSPLGLPVLGVKVMLCILYYEHPDVLRAVGVTEPGEDQPSCLITTPAPRAGEA